jgi:predicted nucleotidyltransferase
LGKGTVTAVAMFGSATYDTLTHHSDIDLLIVVSNQISNRQIRKIEPILKAIEIKHNFALHEKRLDKRITQVIDRMTGMFCSHFICRREAWNRQKFSQIFNVSGLLSRILAPNRIVLDSMKSGARLLYGDLNLEPNTWNYPKTQLIKSLNLTFLLSLGTIFLLPLNKTYMCYALEAYKWSLRSCCYFLFREAWPLSNIVSLFKKYEITNGFLDRFLFLRKHCILDWKFALKLPWKIIKLHITTIKINN